MTESGLYGARRWDNQELRFFQEYLFGGKIAKRVVAILFLEEDISETRRYNFKLRRKKLLLNVKRQLKFLNIKSNSYNRNELSEVDLGWSVQ